MAGSVNRTRRRYQIAAAVPVVVVFATLYTWLVSTLSPTESPDIYLWVALPFAILASLWLSTSWLLVHHWWRRDGVRPSMMDGPERLLSSAVATLAEPRRRWGEAMLAELAQVRGRPARWRFALSCARAALSLPLPTRRPVLAIASGVVVAAWAAVSFLVVVTMPGLFFFAVGFVALMGLMVLLLVARGRRLRPAAPTATALVAGAVAASVVALVALEVQLPAAVTVLPPVRAGFLAVMLAGCLWLAVAPPRWMAGGRLAPIAGTGAAVAFALGLLALGVTRVEDGPSIVWLLAAPELTFIIPAFIAAAITRSFRAGVQAGIWTAIAVAPLAYAGGLAGALVEFGTSDRVVLSVGAMPSGFSFAFAVLVLAVIPALGFPFAVIGATVGTRLRDRGAQVGHAVPVAES